MAERTIRLKTINIIIGIMLIVGSLFVSVNFISPHTTSTKVTLATINNFHLNGYPPETLQQSTDNIYRSIHAINITNGQTLEVSWYSDIILGVFIFSEEQFAYFQSILPQMHATGNTPDAVEWADKNGITCEAVGWAHEGEVSYNVLKTGKYVAVITNAMYGAAYATIWDFDVNLISYKQTASLYLYLGVLLVILGIAQLTLMLFKQKLSKTTLR